MGYCHWLMDKNKEKTYVPDYGYRPLWLGLSLWGP